MNRREIDAMERDEVTRKPFSQWQRGPLASVKQPCHIPWFVLTNRIDCTVRSPRG